MVHPSAKILAEGGPIVIGEGNLIQEKAYIVNRLVWDGRASSGVKSTTSLWSPPRAYRLYKKRA